MFGRVLKGMLIIGGAGFALPAHGSENLGQTLEKTGKICIEQTRFQERNRGIPEHLLTAISHVESGRWSPSHKANVAWPWTVTSGGAGRFFDSKEEALAEVEFLMTEGIRNIDVGCMQINLHYHADAFDTLSDAFDPVQNTAYAASFLSKLKTSSNSWIDAAGTYHSSTPDKKAYYQSKLMSSWNTQRGLTQVATATADALRTTSQSPRPEIDYARMNRLNAAFKQRVSTDPIATDKIGRAKKRDAIRQRELRDWQDARASGKNITHLLAMRRAQQKQRQRRKLATMGVSKFPQKRQEQLQKWRDKGIWYGG